ncbi:hypothetical protein L107_08023 [Cyanobium sp. Copco_Reservoir_LC18]|uniref:serine protease inhibitor n=1 Tax=Cyanobium sp. Copco_Reservoir_LC18 TaxID=1328305 RepID=UPI0013582A09|nr:serine protease inhibitor [Cyanobium sp. Copco_Reservoir_LC18]KAF0653523.1 hypothetical protein L107_08023 [Cyanobium sp. Copco_Reservoir_LC18]
MTTSSFGASLPAGLVPSRPLRRAPARHHRAAAPLLLAVALVLGAVVLAPEQPLDQEAICHRHNGVEACRVW